MRHPTYHFALDIDADGDHTVHTPDIPFPDLMGTSRRVEFSVVYISGPNGTAPAATNLIVFTEVTYGFVTNERAEVVIGKRMFQQPIMATSPAMIELLEAIWAFKPPF